MLVTLEGTVREDVDDMVVVEVNGLGYGVRVPLGDRQELQPDQSVKLYIYQHLREDTDELYGFVHAQDRQLFTQLISVSGVGPKLALTVMSGVGGKQLHQAIASGNSDMLQSISGVGKRTAERIVVELKNRLGAALDAAATTAPGSDAVLAALKQLGYGTSEAAKAAANIPADLKNDEAKLKFALKELAK